jgi:hypothetical protein
MTVDEIDRELERLMRLDDKICDAIANVFRELQRVGEMTQELEDRVRASTKAIHALRAERQP